MRKIKYLFCLLFLISCANVPYHYYSLVTIKSGVYTGMYGRIIDDCDGFENYLVRIIQLNQNFCFRIWDLKRRDYNE